MCFCTKFIGEKQAQPGFYAGARDFLFEPKRRFILNGLIYLWWILWISMYETKSSSLRYKDLALGWGGFCVCVEIVLT